MPYGESHAEKTLGYRLVDFRFITFFRDISREKAPLREFP